MVAWYRAHPEQRRARDAARYSAYREQILAQSAASRALKRVGIVHTPCQVCGRPLRRDNSVGFCSRTPECRKARDAVWHRKNRDSSLVRERERLTIDLNFRLRRYLRNRTRGALKGGWKSGSAVNDLGCTVDEGLVYLKSKFQPGMTWDNWGQGIGKWNVDHIIPLASVDLEDREQFLKVSHYTNLQPLWSEDNLSKGAKPILDWLATRG